MFIKLGMHIYEYRIMADDFRSKNAIKKKNYL